MASPNCARSGATDGESTPVIGSLPVDPSRPRYENPTIRQRANIARTGARWSAGAGALAGASGPAPNRGRRPAGAGTSAQDCRLVRSGCAGSRRLPRGLGGHDRGPGTAVAPPHGAPRARTVASRAAGLVNGIAERLGQLVHPFGREEEPRRPHQLLVAQRVVRDALSHDLLLEQSDAVDQTFGPRRASRHVDIDRDDGIDALHHRVIVEDAV